MEYAKLIHYAISNPVLGKAIQDMADESGMLNLVDPDWEAKLNAYPIHQLHKDKKVLFSKGKACSDNKAYVRNVALPSLSYKVILLGSWYCERLKSKDLDGVPGDLTFIARECPPLAAIGDAMVESSYPNLHDGARLFMELCSASLCYHCSTQHQKYNVPLDMYKNWCVTKTRMFDGQQLKNAFKFQLEPILERISSFSAICQLHIYSRTTFGDGKYKIGGKIKNIITFQESSIKPVMEMNFMITPEHLAPAIEFPTEVEEEQVIDAR